MSEQLLNVKITGDASGLKTALDGVKSELQTVQKDIGGAFESAGTKLSSFGGDISKKVTLPIAGIGVASFKFAADLQDAMGATEQIYGNSADDVKQWASNLESYYGIAEGDALSHANMMGTMLQNIGGLSEAEAQKQAATLIELSGDLSAMYGGTVPDAVAVMTAALKGNYSTLDNYGISATAATVAQKALEMGLVETGESAAQMQKKTIDVEKAQLKYTEAVKKHGEGSLEAREAEAKLAVAKENLAIASERVSGELSAEAKQQAVLQIITEQTGAAQGQAAREYEGASGSMRALTTEITNLATELGGVLLPIFTPIIAAIGEWVAKFKELSPETKEMIVKIGLLAAAIGPVIMVLGSMATGIGSIISVGGKMAGLFGKLGGAGSTLAGVLTKTVGFLFSPAGMILVGIAAAIAIGVLLYKNWDTIKEYAQKLWDGVKATFTAMKDGIKVIFDAIKETMVTIFGAAKDAVIAYIELLKKVWTTIFEAIKTVVTTIFNAIKDVMMKVFDAAKNAVIAYLELLKKTWTTIFEAIKLVVTTIFNAIKDVMTKVIESAKTLVLGTVDKIKSGFSEKFEAAKEAVLGIFDKIKTGITDKIDAAKDAVFNAIEKIKSFFKFEWSLPKLKMPSFKIDGKFSLNPPSVPRFNVQWNARGAIFKKPTVLGNGQGVGDASNGFGSSPEVVAPLSDLKQMLGLDDGSKGGPVINLYGNYGFKDKEDMDYFMNELALAGRRG